MARKKLKWWMVMVTVLLIVLAPVTFTFLAMWTMAKCITELSCDVFGCDYPGWASKEL